MGIFDQMFSKEKQQSNPNQQQQNQPQNQNSDQQNQQDPTNLSNKSNPNNNPPADPLAPFAKLFDTQSNSEAPKAPSFKLDPNVVKQVTESLDFSSSVTPEILEQMQSNPDQGFKALANNLGRLIYQNSLDHTTALTGKFVEARSKFDRSGLDQAVNSRLSKNSLESIAANNPIAKKHLETIAEDLMRSNPDASPEWIKEMTPKYFLEMARLTNPDAFAQQQSDSLGNGSRSQANGKQVDWNEWLTR